MARKVRICAACGAMAADRGWDVHAFYTSKRFPTCGFDCFLSFGNAYHAREESDEPAMVRARERHQEQEEYRSERQKAGWTELQDYMTVILAMAEWDI